MLPAPHPLKPAPTPHALDLPAEPQHPGSAGPQRPSETSSQCSGIEDRFQDVQFR